MRISRMSTQILTLLAVLLLAACNLSPQEDALPTATPTTAADTKPTVSIISPESGSQHRVNAELSVTVNVKDALGVTRIMMTANGQPVKTVSPPSNEKYTDKNLSLDYIPLVAGDVVLQVTAYRGALASEPAQVTVRIGSVQPTATTGIIITQGPSIDPNDPTCRALINNGLNLREGPGTSYRVLTTLAQGQVIPVTGRLGDNSWYRLSHGQGGWVSGQFVSLYGSLCMNVQIVSPPATATVFVPPSPIPPTSIPPSPTPQPSSTPGTPDLVITVFEGPGSRPTNPVIIPAGETEVKAEYQLIVANIGSRATSSFTVSLQVHPEGEIVKAAISELRPNESTNILLTYTYKETGTFILEAMVDADSQVTEISEANNRSQLAITVR